MIQKNAFEEWFDEYFCNQQGEDSPYSYEDIVEAFSAGVQAGKITTIRKPRVNCKHLYADWCHNPKHDGEHQTKCGWYCYGEQTDCPDYELKEGNGKRNTGDK